MASSGAGQGLTPRFFGTVGGPRKPELHTLVRAWAGKVFAKNPSARAQLGGGWQRTIVDGHVTEKTTNGSDTLWRITWPTLTSGQTLLTTWHGAKFWKRPRNFPNGIVEAAIVDHDNLGPDDIDMASDDSSSSSEDGSSVDDTKPVPRH